MKSYYTKRNISESVDNTTDEITIETVDAKGSKIDNVEVLSQLALFMEMMSSKFDQKNTNLNEFRTEVKSEINVVNMSLNELKSENNNLNASLNEFKIEIKSEINASNIELKTETTKQDKKLREIDNKLEEQNKTIAGMKSEIIININKIQDKINENRTLKEEVENDTVTSECDEITDDQGNNKITNNYEGIIDKVGVSYENELTTDSSKIVENEIYKNDIVKIISNHNNIETEREYEENDFVNIGQRVNFPQFYGKPRWLQMFLKGKSPLQENDVFLSNFLIFSRRFYDLIPSVRNDSKSMHWCYDERYVDKKVKLFKVSRGYDDLIKRLDIERVSDNKYLPCEIVSTAIDDIDYLLYDKANTAVDNNNNETVIDITVTGRTKGDWTILDNKLYDLITWNNPVDIVEAAGHHSSVGG